MTCGDTIEWMRQNRCLKYWLLPLNGLNDGTAYAGRPVGNSPEMMPWDNSLNKDLDDVFKRHAAFTKNLPIGDPLKFCSSTPKRLDSAYTRLVDPALGDHGGIPSSNRIVQDIKKCSGPHLIAIIENKGAVVPGLGNARHGKRRVTGIEKHGGHRVNGAYKAASSIGVSEIAHSRAFSLV